MSWRRLEKEQKQEYPLWLLIWDIVWRVLWNWSDSLHMGNRDRKKGLCPLWAGGRYHLRVCKPQPADINQVQILSVNRRETPIGHNFLKGNKGSLRWGNSLWEWFLNCMRETFGVHCWSWGDVTEERESCCKLKYGILLLPSSHVLVFLIKFCRNKTLKSVPNVPVTKDVEYMGDCSVPNYGKRVR